MQQSFDRNPSRSRHDSESRAVLPIHIADTFCQASDPLLSQDAAAENPDRGPQGSFQGPSALAAAPDHPSRDQGGPLPNTSSLAARALASPPRPSSATSTTCATSSRRRSSSAARRTATRTRATTTSCPSFRSTAQDLFSIGVAAQVLRSLGGTPLAQSLDPATSAWRSSCRRRSACAPRSSATRSPCARSRPIAPSAKRPGRPSPKPCRAASRCPFSTAIRESRPARRASIRPYAIVLAGRDWICSPTTVPGRSRTSTWRAWRAAR